MIKWNPAGTRQAERKYLGEKDFDNEVCEEHPLRGSYVAKFRSRYEWKSVFLSMQAKADTAKGLERRNVKAHKENNKRYSWIKLDIHRLTGNILCLDK